VTGAGAKEMLASAATGKCSFDFRRNELRNGQGAGGREVWRRGLVLCGSAAGATPGGNPPASPTSRPPPPGPATRHLRALGAFLAGRGAALRGALDAARAKGLVRCVLDAVPSKEAVAGVCVIVASFLFAFLIGFVVLTVMPAM